MVANVGSRWLSGKRSRVSVVVEIESGDCGGDCLRLPNNGWTVDGRRWRVWMGGWRMAAGGR